MLGRKSVHASGYFAGNFIGADFGLDQDLTKNLPEEWRAFNREFIHIYLAKRPEKSKITAGLACGALWTIAKEIKKRDGAEHSLLPVPGRFQTDWTLR